jgi:hypothetical protein
MIQKGRTTAYVVVENVNRNANTFLEFLYGAWFSRYEWLKMAQIGNAAPCRCITY